MLIYAVLVYSIRTSSIWLVRRSSVCPKRNVADDAHLDMFSALPDVTLKQVFIDYNISGMSYVHLRHALFLQPLPEVSSVPSSQQPAPDSVDSTDNPNLPPLSGIFTSVTVPETFVANPLGRCTPGRSPTRASTNKQRAGSTAGGAGGTATARELRPVVLQGDTEEVYLCMCVCVWCRCLVVWIRGGISYSRSGRTYLAAVCLFRLRLRLDQ